jgi:hypothetical protein
MRRNTSGRYAQCAIDWGCPHSAGNVDCDVACGVVWMMQGAIMVCIILVQDISSDNGMNSEKPKRDVDRCVQRCDL